MTDKVPDDGSLDIDFGNVVESDIVSFDNCDCGSPIPDPLVYELPDGSGVGIVGCQQCGGAIDWDTQPDETRQALREAVSRRDSAVRRLATEVKEKRTSINALREDLTDEEASARELQAQLKEKTEQVESLSEKLDQPRSNETHLEAKLQSKAREVHQLQRCSDDNRSESGSRSAASSFVAGAAASGITAYLTWVTYPEAIVSFRESFTELAETQAYPLWIKHAFTRLAMGLPEDPTHPSTPTLMAAMVAASLLAWLAMPVLVGGSKSRGATTCRPQKTND